ncbi:trigger factor [Actinomarinicola tropica]|uniref:trigger factor n=1 Tax=Actinomarinicola tropica TaxID=2789776 RepID=UPI0018976423|nr:trigger factor [Actinomarinicola tropica]
MKTTVEPLEGNKVRLSIEVDESEFEPALDAAFRRIAQEVRLPGFRPGKAPRKLLEARLGKGVAREEALRESLPSFYSDAVVEHEVDVIAAPEIEITSGEETGPVTFDAVVEVRPTIEISGYESLDVELPSPTVSDEELDEQVDRLRNQYAELVAVERPAADGDVVRIDIEGSRDGEPIEGLSAAGYSYEVGLGQVVAELDENLRGASAGDHLEFSGDDHTHDEDELDEHGHPPHGPIDFVVDVVEVQEKVLPELTDEWAAEASEFSTVEELRADLRARLERSRAAQAESALRNATAEALAALVEIEAPQPMVSSEMQQQLQNLSMSLQAQGLQLEQFLAMTGQPQAQFVETLREGATQAVLVDLALRAVAAAEGIDVDESEVDEELERLAERVGETVERVREEFERSGQLPEVRSDLRKQKALDWLIERVAITDPQGNSIDRADLIAAAEAADEAEQTAAEDTPDEDDTEGATDQ